MLGRFCTGRVGMLRRFEPSVLPVFTQFIQLVCFYSSVGNPVCNVKGPVPSWASAKALQKWCDVPFDWIAFTELMKN